MTVLRKSLLSILAAMTLTLTACSTTLNPDTATSVNKSSMATMSQVDKAELDPIAQDLIQRALNDNTAYELTESLTQEVGPRFVGTPGDLAGIEWGKRKLNELGFDHIHTEPVEAIKWTRGDIKVQITAPFSQELVATALGGSLGSNGDINAEVVMTETVDTFKDIAAEDVKGKIVFFNRVMERSKDGSGYSKAGRERWQGHKDAAAKGALAVLIRPAGTSHHRFAHTGSMGRYELGESVPSASLTNADADILAYAIENVPSTAQKVTMTVNIGSRFEGKAMTANVVGQLTGSERPNEVILLGAHLDSWDLGTGAIDDASGIGIITAAAKLIKDAGLKPKRSIRLVYFGNEEFGLDGAREYARRHEKKVKQHIVGMESDFGAGKIWRFASMLPDNMLPLKEQILANIKPLGVEPGNNKSGGGADLGPMRTLGMPTFAFTQDGTKYFDYHHTADDTLDKVDPEDLKQNVAIYAVAAYLAANYELDE